MTIQVINTDTLETVDFETGVLAMDMIHVHTLSKEGKIAEAYMARADLKMKIADVDGATLNDALYFYEQATGQLGINTFCR